LGAFTNDLRSKAYSSDPRSKAAREARESIPGGSCRLPRY